MNNWIAAALVVMAAGLGYAVADRGSVAKVETCEPSKPGEFMPGKQVIGGKVALAYMGLGDTIEMWVGAYPKPNGTVQLRIVGDTIHVVRDGKPPIGSTGVTQ